MSVSKEAHKKAYPIRIPLNKGLVSYRLFLIHKDNADQFKQISTIDRLKKLIPGQGLGWNDVDILKCN
ncbi:MAG: hypothetical protein GY714_05515 [Desulfobacterales bacterium]|nr:hypothetical protein [Desulfobacterales bacterium]